MTRTEKENLVPVWERITISLEEAAAYSGIGVRKLRDMTDKPECNYVIWVGNRRIIAGRFQRALHQKCLVEVQYLRT